jgi:capsular polysaccharide biosynthesis protein
MKVNDTTRTFPRTLEEAFPSNVQDVQRIQQGEWMEAHTPDHEKYLNILYAFVAGFITAMLVFGAK